MLEYLQNEEIRLWTVYRCPNIMNDSEKPQDPKDRANNPVNKSKNSEEHPKKDAFDLSSDKLPEKD